MHFKALWFSEKDWKCIELFTSINISLQDFPLAWQDFKLTLFICPLSPPPSFAHFALEKASILYNSPFVFLLKSMYLLVPFRHKEALFCLTFSLILKGKTIILLPYVAATCRSFPATFKHYIAVVYYCMSKKFSIYWALLSQGLWKIWYQPYNEIYLNRFKHERLNKH